MAFRLEQSPSYRWPVQVTLTGEDGHPVESTFHMDFKRLSQTDLEKLIEQFQNKDEQGRLTDRQFCEQHVLGWCDVQWADGNPVIFSPDAMRSLLDIIGVQAAIVRAFFDSVRLGQEKNSEKPPEPGLMQRVVQH